LGRRFLCSSPAANRKTSLYCLLPAACCLLNPAAGRAQLILSLPTTLTAHPGDTIPLTLTEAGTDLYAAHGNGIAAVGFSISYNPSLGTVPGSNIALGSLISKPSYGFPPYSTNANYSADQIRTFSLGNPVTPALPPTTSGPMAQILFTVPVGATSLGTLISNPGYGLPNYTTNNTAGLIRAVTSSSAGTPSLPASTSGTLASIQFTVSSSAAPGTYTLSLLPSSSATTTSVVDNNFNTYDSTSGLTLVNGSLIVSPVPEPSTLLLTGLAAFALRGWRRRPAGGSDSYRPSRLLGR
jgi:PEP-CTERM motif